MSTPQRQPLHLLFFPLFAPGHLLPMTNIAALFTARGVKSTILTTPANAAVIRSAIDATNNTFRATGIPPIALELIPFPDVGLPPGVESATGISSHADRAKFYQAAELLQHPFHEALSVHRPDAVVTDSFFAWSADAAAAHGVPRIAFQGTGLFARCAQVSVLRHNPMESVVDTDPDAVVAVPGLPHRVELHRSQMMDPKKRPDMWAYYRRMNAGDARSYGEVVNSFHDLEAAFAEHYHKALGRRAWLVGPVSLSSHDVTTRGDDKLAVDAGECVRWLDKRPPGSVVYVCFGTLSQFSAAQLRELARGLDVSGKDFVWVVKGAEAEASEWLPAGFEQRMLQNKRGLIIRGWAPQVIILSHSAVGGFVTHCGWNSCIEAVSAGVPMVTWPLYADQFYNEKLILEVLKVGAGVGAKEFASKLDVRQVIKGEVIGEAIGQVMGEQAEAKAMRARALALRDKARHAMEKGGSSYSDIRRLIEELMARRNTLKD